MRVSLGLQEPPTTPDTGVVNAGLGLGLARRIAEMHGGAFEDSPAQLTLVLPAG
jgi:signal transduction histidine kinase